MVDGPPRGNHDKVTIMKKVIGWAIIVGLLVYAISYRDEAYGHTLPEPVSQGQGHATD